MLECHHVERCSNCSSVQLRSPVVSDSLQPHESQQARPSAYDQLPELAQTHVHRVGDANHLIACLSLLLPSIFPKIEYRRLGTPPCPVEGVGLGSGDYSMRGLEHMVPESSSSSQGFSLKGWTVSPRNRGSLSVFWTACLFQAYDSLLYFYKSIKSEV